MKNLIKSLIESSKTSDDVVDSILETSAGNIPHNGDTIRFLQDDNPFKRGDTSIIFSVDSIDSDKKVYKLTLMYDTKKVIKEYRFEDVDKIWEFVYGKN